MSNVFYILMGRLQSLYLGIKVHLLPWSYIFKDDSHTFARFKSSNNIFQTQFFSKFCIHHTAYKIDPICS